MGTLWHPIMQHGSSTDGSSSNSSSVINNSFSSVLNDNAGR